MQNNYDSEICGNLPVHIINLIQPYGFLMVLNREDLSIVQVSENINDLFGLPAEQLVNTDPGTYITERDRQQLADAVKNDLHDKVPLLFTATRFSGTAAVLATVHAGEKCILVEMEYSPEVIPGFMEVFRELKHSMAAIEREQTIEAVCDLSVKELKRLSGYDSVLMYRFDADWNGTVVAESTVEEMSSYMGLKFPASDVPKQVRQLYLKNPYRMIPDRNFIPVKLYPVMNPVTGTLTDLSDCNLRSVPAVHLEYMKNMGLEASLSVRVIVGGRLWGLISCHHRSARYLKTEIRSMLELISSIISNKIAAVLDKMEYDATASLNEQCIRLTDHIYQENNWMASLLDHDINLLTLFNLQGAVILYQGNRRSLGIVPDKDDIETLIFWLQAKEINTVYAVTNLSELNESATQYADIGSGIIVLPIHPGKGDFIIGFRQEVVKNVNWGGNPDEALVFEENGSNYHPRNSFKVWKQIVKNTSLPWSSVEIKIAERLRNNLFEYLLKQSIKEA